MESLGKGNLQRGFRVQVQGAGAPGLAWEATDVESSGDVPLSQVAQHVIDEFIEIAVVLKVHIHTRPTVALTMPPLQ